MRPADRRGRSCAASASGGSPSFAVSLGRSSISTLYEEYPPPRVQPATDHAVMRRARGWAAVYSAAHNCHIQRGGGTGPIKPRQPPREGKVPIPAGKTWEM